MHMLTMFRPLRSLQCCPRKSRIFVFWKKSFSISLTGAGDRERISSKSMLRKPAFPEKIIFLLVLHFVRKPQKTIFSGKAPSIILDLKLF